MYDTLMDDIGQSDSHDDNESNLSKKSNNSGEMEDDLGAVGLSFEEDYEEPADEEEETLDGLDTETWSDDPVRMYLTQMGEIPLLSRQEEVTLAKRIEDARARFRRKLLECDFVMQHAVRVLHRVEDGDLPFDRTIQVSVSDHLEKDQILGRLPNNLKTLDVLLKRNSHDYQIATSKSKPLQQRKEAWLRVGRRRRRAVQLIEELGLRTQRIEPMVQNLVKFSRRVDELR
ncbi:MAG: sigma-70 factor domain-containing protein, partial [Planctomycetia bacterium]